MHATADLCADLCVGSFVRRGFDATGRLLVEPNAAVYGPCGLDGDSLLDWTMPRAITIVGESTLDLEHYQRLIYWKEKGGLQAPLSVLCAYVQKELPVDAYGLHRDNQTAGVVLHHYLRSSPILFLFPQFVPWNKINRDVGTKSAQYSWVWCADALLL